MNPPLDGTWIVAEATISAEENGCGYVDPFVGRMQYRGGDWAGADGLSIRSHPDEVVHVHRWVPAPVGRAILNIR